MTTREQIRGLIKDIQVTNPGKIRVDLSGPGPQFHCASCDFAVYWSDNRFICPACEYEFSVMNAIDLLQIQIDQRQDEIDKMIPVQVGMLDLLPDDLKGQAQVTVAQGSGSKSGGFWSRFRRRKKRVQPVEADVEQSD